MHSKIVPTELLLLMAKYTLAFNQSVKSHYNCCDRKSRAAYVQSFTLWQQATIEFTCHDHSPPRLVVMFNR